MSEIETKIDTSIVMATCSRAGMLREALASLLREAEGLGRAVEFVVVDDGSTDGTAEVLAAFASESRVPVRVLAGQRKGVAAARNLGSFAARGEWLASFDDDQIALPGWLRHLREAADESGAAVVGGSLRLQLPGGASAETFGARARRVLGEHRPGEVAGPYAQGVLPATNNVLIRGEVFARLRGYDVRFTEGGEDTDFFSRVRDAGESMWFAPQAEALHVMTARRLERSNLRWTSMRIGAGEARVRARGGGLVRHAVARLGVAVLRDGPQLLFAKMRGSASGALDVWCSLWYTGGLLRALPGVLRGRESGFLRSMDFRGRGGERGESESQGLKPGR